MKALAQAKTPINVATLVGHCNLRLAVMGYRMALPTPEELRRMGDLLAISLEQGALGLSLGFNLSSQQLLEYGRTDLRWAKR